MSQIFPPDVLTVIEAAEARLYGWCERQKSEVLVELVLHDKPALCVEIGVFGGRSLMPIAAALRHLGAGWVVGIETWNAEIAIENATSEENDRWWRTVDYRSLKKAFWTFALELDLTDHITIVEARSSVAATLFEQIDFLHIDGSHALYSAAEDVIRFMPLVKREGIVIMDDVNWETVMPAVQIAKAKCSVEKELVAQDGIVHGLVLRKH